MNNLKRPIDPRIILSTLWIFVMFNYLYCDLLTLMDHEVLNELLTGKVGDLEMTQGFLLGSAILMEIPIAMVLLSRILNYTANRWANIAAGFFMSIVQLVSLFIGTPTYFYVFFSVIEISGTLLVVWTAWRWREPAPAN